MPLITIDGEDARDFDDAVYCEPVELGTGQRKRPGACWWRSPTSATTCGPATLDDDAVERAPVYFPRRVIPMLPESLSNGLCSLNPEVDRLVLVCDMVIPASGAKAGTVTAYQFYNAVMYRMPAPPTPTSPGATAAQWTGRACHARSVAPRCSSPVRAKIHAGAGPQETRRHRFRHTVETKIVATSWAALREIAPSVRNDAHKLIEECMLPPTPARPTS